MYLCIYVFKYLSIFIYILIDLFIVNSYIGLESIFIRETGLKEIDLILTTYNLGT